MVNDNETCFEFLCNGWRVVCRANHVATLDLLLVDASEVKANIVPSFSRIHLAVVSLDGLDFSNSTRRHDNYFIVCLHLPCFDPAHRHGPDACD